MIRKRHVNLIINQSTGCLDNFGIFVMFLQFLLANVFQKLLKSKIFISIKHDLKIGRNMPEMCGLKFNEKLVIVKNCCHLFHI